MKWLLLPFRFVFICVTLVFALVAVGAWVVVSFTIESAKRTNTTGDVEE